MCVQKAMHWRGLKSYGFMYWAIIICRVYAAHLTRAHCSCYCEFCTARSPYTVDICECGFCSFGLCARTQNEMSTMHCSMPNTMEPRVNINKSNIYKQEINKLRKYKLNSNGIGHFTIAIQLSKFINCNFCPPIIFDLFILMRHRCAARSVLRIWWWIEGCTRVTHI